MSAVLCTIIVGLSNCASVHGETQGELYSSNHEPKPPEAFPSKYRDYQILPGTISPDGRHALIYPKRSRLYLLDDYGLYLAALKPFHVLAELPLGNSNLAENARSDFSSHWTPDSSAIVMIADKRWGPERVSVLRIKKGKVIRQTELTAQVRRLVGPDYRKSHAERYNDNYDFVFSEGYSGGDQFVEVPERWDFDAAGHLSIDCVCTTDPKDIDKRRWTIRFNGVWDIDKEMFLEKKFARIPFTRPSLEH